MFKGQSFVYICKIIHTYMYHIYIIIVKPVLRGHLWDKEKNGLIRPVTSKRFNSYELFYNRKRQMWPFNTGNCLIEVTVYKWTQLQLFVRSTKISQNPYILHVGYEKKLVRRIFFINAFLNVSEI
jgi:hypothetical protein